MTKPALITEHEGKRLARIAKAEGVIVRVFKDGTRIEFTPDIPANHNGDTVDVNEECDL